MTRRSAVLISILVAVLAAAPTPAAADEHETIDDRAHVSWVDGVIDSEGQLWFKIGFYIPWDEIPPRDLFSLFFELSVTVDGETKTVGWQTHDGVETFLGDPDTQQAFILDNGCVLVATGIYPTAPYDVSIQANFASWQDESTNSVSGSESMGTSSDFVQIGDPFILVGTPVFDLTTGQPVDDTTSGGADDDTTPSTSGTTDTLGDSTSDTLGSTGGSGSSSDGSFISAFLTFLGILALLFLLWWFGFRPRRYAYRADREVGLDIVEDGTDKDAGKAETLELEAEPIEGGFPVVLDEPDTTFEDPCWEQNQKLSEAQDRLGDLETEQRETDPTHEETHKALDQAIEQARENVAAAQKALDECIAAHTPPTTDSTSGTPTAPPPTPPAIADVPQVSSKDCKEEEEAYAAAVAATDRATELRDVAEAAWLEAHSTLSSLENQVGEAPPQAELDAARVAEAKALTQRDESVAAQDAAIEAENSARLALDACKGQRSDDAGTDDGGTEQGDTGPRGTETVCTDGAEEWRFESRSRPFTVLDGDVRLRISNAPASWGAWQRANGTATTVPAAALGALTEDEMTELLSPLPENRRVIPSIAIPTKTVRVSCERLWKCNAGQWEATDQLRKNPKESQRPDERFGGRDISTVGNIVDLLQRVKTRLDELERELEEGRAFECE